ncbi:MAG: hypothetical protein ACI382_02925 [Alloprevotella sp.]
MKKIFYVAATAAMLASCSTDFDLSEVFGSGGTSETIGFQVQKGNNVTRATTLQSTGHYNFGVFGYKESDQVNPIFPDYLVGYFDDNLAYQKVGSTWGDGDGVEDGKPYWMYEGLGKDEYFGTYAGQALTRFYQSNNKKQFLKYWDKSATHTCFYAYAPYVGTETSTARVTYVDGVAQQATGSDTYVLNIPDGTLVAGYDDPTKYEFMYASKKVAAADYGHDVSLDFKRLVAKVNIKFWEDVPGYSVRIIDLKQDEYEGVQATPAIYKDSDSPAQTYKPYGYRAGKYYTKNGVKIKFEDGVEKHILQYQGTTADNTAPLKFAVPTESAIGTNRYQAAKSATDYYAIPKGTSTRVLKTTKDGGGNVTGYEDFPADPSTDTWGNSADADLAKTGFTFHVSYELTAEDTGERIVVKNATVHVPYNYCNWKENTHYTYIFKITKNSNGSTDTDPTIDPTDPDVPTDQALYPIVFDNCTVQDWDENESEWEITEGGKLTYHNVTLNKYSVDPSDTEDNRKLTVTIGIGDSHNGAAVDYDKYGRNNAEGNGTINSGIKVTDYNGTNNVTNWYDSSTKQITVPADAQEGVYVVTYTCPGSDLNKNHPKTWTAKFYVGQAYTISTAHSYVGTGFTGSSISLGVTGSKSGTTGTISTLRTGLSIDYPDNFEDDDKNKVEISSSADQVVIKNNAVPGTYKVVYTVKIDGVDVKVAEKTFEVIDFNFTLNPTVVYNNVREQTVTCSQKYVAGERTYSVSTGAGVSVNDATNTIKVTNAATDNATHTVTYTVWNDDSKATYTKTFKTANSHSVAISKTSIDRNQGTGSVGAETTDCITVTTKKNGENTTTDLTSKLVVVQKNANGEYEAVSGDNFTITHTSGNSYTLKCKNDTPVGTYYVKYTDIVLGSNKAEYSPAFVVTE